MAATRVVDLPSRYSLKVVKSVHVYKTYVKLIISTDAEARAANGLSPAFNAPEPQRASSVWE